MGWVFTMTRAGGGTQTLELRSPDFGDRHRSERMQARGDTDGGQRYVQDLGHTVTTFEGTWTNVTTCERSAMEKFFGVDGTLFMAYPFSIEVDDEEDPPIGISTGMGLSTGEGYSSGQLVAAVGQRWGTAWLDQPALEFSHDRRDGRYAVNLRLRIEDDAVALPA